jgi:hypothetical protein
VETEGGDLDLYRDVERELCRIPDVTAARIVAGPGGQPVEVHVLASPHKHAKQIVRDVQSVAMAAFGLDLDRRIISVVQLDTGETSDRIAAPNVNGNATPVRPSLRIVVDGVTAQRSGTHCSAQVSLSRADVQAIGVAEGLLASSSAMRLVAGATLAALRQIEPAATRADVEMATVVRLGDRTVAVASVVFLVPPYEEVVAGSAVVRTAGDDDAMVRAVLDATNRRLTRLGEL